jgi:hypothetical protein
MDYTQLVLGNNQVLSNKSINYAPAAPDGLHCAPLQSPVIESLGGGG